MAPIKNSVESFELIPFKKKQNKYRNVKTIIDNIEFDSKKEAFYYSGLKLRHKTGEFDSFICQPVFDIVVNGHKICRYIADFAIINGCEIVEVIDCKGFKTPTYNLKKKLMKAVKGIDIKEV